VRARRLSVGAVAIAVLCFSVSSSAIKKSGADGIAVAFWRLLGAAILWNAILIAQGRRMTWATLRRLAVPGALFGLNLAIFFAGVTRTSIVHAEFLAALTPLILLPAGAYFFHERVSARSVGWAGLALLGMAIVLFAGPAKGSARLAGDLLVLIAVTLWAGYLLTAKRARQTFDVVELMAGVTPIASVAAIPLLFIADVDLAMPWGGWVVVAILTLLTGLGAHGLIVYAQRAVPVATIGILQVGQPALAVAWAYLLLGEAIRPIQLAGMALVLAGLATFTWSSQRRVRAA